MSRFVNALSFAAIAALPLSAQGVGQPAGNVRASAQASVSVQPDLALVTINFSAAGRSPSAAGKAAAARAAAIRKAIEAIGIPRDSMPTRGTSAWWWAVGNRSEMQIRNNNRDTSYVTNDQFTVRVHDFDRIGRIIDTALAEGAQTISNVEFRATNTSAATVEAVKKATVLARGYATAIADASGLRLGRALDISTDIQPYYTGMADRLDVSSSMKAAMGAPTQVVAPELKVTVNVMGQWEMTTGGR